MNLAALALIAAFVAVPAAAMSGPCPVPGLAHQRVTLVTATGKHRYDVEVAASADAQECGLMFRQHMARSEGMIFPLAPPRPQTFWMENTVLSLDIIFVAPDNRVLSIAANATPFARDFIPSGGDSSAVIELNAGEAARIGLKPGDRVSR